MEKFRKRSDRHGRKKNIESIKFEKLDFPSDVREEFEAYDSIHVNDENSKIKGDHLKIVAHFEKLGELKNKASSKLPSEMPASLRGLISPEHVQPMNKIVHSASAAAALVGAVPIPVADAVVLIPIQLRMLQKIYQIYGAKFSEGLVFNFIRMTIVPYIGKSLVNLIPGGSIVNAGVAAAITEAIGWSTALSLEKGKDITKNSDEFEQQFMTIVKETMKVKNKKK